MRWTLGLLLLASAGCGYRQTRMVACPETGCPRNMASASPQGLGYTNSGEPRRSAKPNTLSTFTARSRLTVTTSPMRTARLAASTRCPLTRT